MSVYDLLTFDTTGLLRREDVEGRRHWESEVGDLVALIHLPGPPDIDCDPRDAEALRRQLWRVAVETGVGFVETLSVEARSRPSAWVILKDRQEHGLGRIYLGSIMVPFRDFGFVLRVECHEGPGTGMREALVIDRGMQSGEIRIREGAEGRRLSEISSVVGPEDMIGWSIDPVDDCIELGLQPNVSENRKYDEVFPDHPLSRARRMMERLLGTIRFAPELASAPPYVYPPQTAHTASSSSSDQLARLRTESAAWSDEYLEEQHRLGPTAFSTDAAWQIISTEYERRGLCFTTSQRKDGSAEPAQTDWACALSQSWYSTQTTSSAGEETAIGISTGTKLFIIVVLVVVLRAIWIAMTEGY